MGQWNDRNMNLMRTWKNMMIICWGWCSNVYLVTSVQWRRAQSSERSKGLPSSWPFSLFSTKKLICNNMYQQQESTFCFLHPAHTTKKESHLRWEDVKGCESKSTLCQKSGNQCSDWLSCRRAHLVRLSLVVVQSLCDDSNDWRHWPQWLQGLERWAWWGCSLQPPPPPPPGCPHPSLPPAKSLLLVDIRKLWNHPCSTLV